MDIAQISGMFRCACRFTAGLAAMLAATLWLVPASSYVIDMARHAAAIVGLLILVVALAAASMRLLWASAVAVVAAITVFALPLGMRPQTAPIADNVETASESRLSIVVWNTRLEPVKEVSDLMRRVRGDRPDVVALLEVTLDRSGAISPLKSLGYQHHYRGNIALWTRGTAERLPQIDVGVEHDEYVVAAYRVKLEEGRSVVVVIVHLLSPRDAYRWRRSVEMAEVIGAACREYANGGDDVIVLGDFNSASYGRASRRFAETSGLRLVATPWWKGTWPASWPSVLGVAIDQVWLSKNISVIDAQIGPDTRSDHRPLLVRLAG